jgi:chitinase
MRSSNGKVINVYYTSWANYGRNHQVADLGDMINAGVTDVSYAFFDLKQSGAGWVIASGDEWADFQQTFPGSGKRAVNPPDNWEDSDAKRAGNFGQFKKLKGTSAEFNLHLSVGGWTWSKNFSLAVRTPQSRDILSDSIISFFRAYPFFNGVDFDWEYVSEDGKNYGNDGNIVDPQDGNNFREFLKLLRSKMQSNGFGSYIIGMCVVAAPEKAQFNIEATHPLVDEIRIMTYDFHSGAWGETKTAHHANPRRSSHGKWSAEEAVDFYLSRGVPSTKLLIGAAFYSRGFGNTSGMGQAASGNSPDFQFSEEMGVVPYHMLPRPGGVEMWDDEAKAGYSYDAAKRVVNSYDTIESCMEKCRIVHEKNLKGIIVWESAGDVKPNNPRSLTAALRKGMFETNWGVSPPVVALPSQSVPAPAPQPSAPVQAPAPALPPPIIQPSMPLAQSSLDWKEGVQYKIGDKIVFGGKVYNVVNNHTSLGAWRPDIVPALYSPTNEPVPTPAPAPPPPPPIVPSQPVPPAPVPVPPAPVPAPAQPASPSQSVPTGVLNELPKLYSNIIKLISSTPSVIMNSILDSVVPQNLRGSVATFLTQIKSITFNFRDGTSYTLE